MSGTTRRSGVLRDLPQLSSSPSNPASGYSIIYPKTDGKWYARDSAGVETEITNVSINSLTSATPALLDLWRFSDISDSNIEKKGTTSDILERYIDEYMTTHYEYFNDFVTAVATASTGQDIVAANSGTGAGNSTINNSETNRVGQIRLTTGTTATGRAAVASAPTAIRFSGGKTIYETAINITQLSTSSERFQLPIGFADVFSSTDQVDAAYFLYDEGGVSTGSAASANWQIVTCNNSSRTFATTGTSVATATWLTLRIEVNTDGTSVSFFINGSEVTNSPITTNIPTGSTRLTGFGNTIYKSIGTTAVTFDCDYIKVRKNFTTAR